MTKDKKKQSRNDVYIADVYDNLSAMELWDRCQYPYYKYVKGLNEDVDRKIQKALVLILMERLTAYLEAINEGKSSMEIRRVLNKPINIEGMDEVAEVLYGKF